MKSYQQIAGDGTIDRAVGGDTSPASPAHTPTPWNVERPFQEPGVYIAGPNTGLIAKLYEPDARLYNGDKLVSIDGNAARIVACVNACAGMNDPAAEIKALRDALEDAEFLLRKCGNNWKEAGSMADSMKRSANDARAALSAFGGEARK